MPTFRTLRPAQIAGGGAAGLLAAVALFASGFEGLRTHAYRDTGNVWSDCYGHTQGVTPTSVHTPEECMALLQVDVARLTKPMAYCIHRPIPEPMAVAFGDFSYNEGPAALCGSQIISEFNKGNFSVACQRLNQGADGKPRWVFGRVHGKLVVLPGLITRRAAERKKCEEAL